MHVTLPTFAQGFGAQPTLRAIIIKFYIKSYSIKKMAVPTEALA